MKIDAAASYLFSTQRALSGSNDVFKLYNALRAEPLQNTNSATSENKTADTKQADFTRMTRQEMRDWVNNQIRNGQLSLDDGAPLFLMTMKMPVNGGPEIPAETDLERINFIERAQLGLDGARWRNDPAEAKLLQVAIDIMLTHQGQTIGVDTRA